MAISQEAYKFELYPDFFIKDLGNTIYFGSKSSRDSYFANLDRKYTFGVANFNYVTDQQSIRVPSQYCDYHDISTCTYGCFYEANETNPDRYYFNIINTLFINGYTTEVNFIIDPFVTYPIPGTYAQMYNTQIVRTHLPSLDYEENIRYLTHNNDTIYSGSNVYSVQQKLYQFAPLDGYYVVWQSAVNIEDGFDSFGDSDTPLFPSSRGNTFDRITSPVGIYVATREAFLSFMNDLKAYAWISQNFIKVSLIPAAFLSASVMQRLDKYDDYMLYKFRTNTSSVDSEISDLSYTWQQIYDIFKLDMKTERHILRYPYCYATATAWNGKEIEIRFEDIENEDGLQFIKNVCIGYHNEVAIYPKNYNSLNENNLGPIEGKGDFLNNAIILDSFDNIPVLIDNYNLNYAQNAYRRELAESRLISSRIQNIISGSDTQSRFYDAVSAISNFSPLALGNKFIDEYEFYRTQNAELSDSKLTKPTITDQTNTNALTIKEEIYGITLKFKQVAPEIIDNVRLYHKRYGFDFPFIRNTISLNSMTKANYYKCNLSNYKIPDVDSKISEIFRLRLENGITMWNLPVGDQDISKNEMR